MKLTPKFKKINILKDLRFSERCTSGCGALTLDDCFPTIGKRIGAFIFKYR
jgi:hypothetical protein